MLMPLGTDVKNATPPVANFVIIGLTVLAFLAIGSAEKLPEGHPMILSRWSPGGFLGHIWVHEGILHLAGNMFFLGVFGGAVCSRVGNFFYPLVYIGFGLAAGLAHVVMVDRPAVGASGAVAGIMGMFAVMFPDSRMRLMWVFAFFGGTIRVPASLAILAWFALNTYGAFKIQGNVGYWAHLGGFIVGFVAAVVAISRGWLRMLPGERTLASLGGDKPAETRPSKKNGVAARPPAATAQPGAHTQAPPSNDIQIRTRCSICGTKLAFSSEQQGKPARCTGCGKLMIVPTRTV